MKSRTTAAAPFTVVELIGQIAEDLPDYARSKIAGVLSRTTRPVLHSRLRLTRHRDPARERPVTAQVNVDIDGRLLHVEVEATTPREAVDRLVDRLAHRLERAALHWEARRGRTYRSTPSRAAAPGPAAGGA
jgi:ribosome-associated translation inhibitor RaiA